MTSNNLFGENLVSHQINGLLPLGSTEIDLISDFNPKAAESSISINLQSDVIFDTIQTIAEQSQNLFIFGTSGNDRLSGDSRDNLILGKGGADLLWGGNGFDLLIAGSGEDSLLGAGGDDYLRGQNDADLLLGGEGNDLAIGNQGDDYLQGDGGDDLLWGGKDRDTIDGGDNEDRIDGGDGEDILIGGKGNDTLRGGQEDSERDIFVISAKSGQDVILDFQNNLDKIGLSGIGFDDLTIIGDKTEARLQLTETGETLAILDNFDVRGLSRSDFIDRFEYHHPDLTPPEITAALAADTGIDNNDGLTFDPTIKGTVKDDVELVSFQGRISSSNFDAAIDLTHIVHPDGSFTLDRQQLAILNDGHSLGYGDYTVELIATDRVGNSSTLAVQFHLDLSHPKIDARLANDTGIDNNDGLTFDPTIVGNVTDGSEIVRLQASFDSTHPEDLVDITHNLHPDNSFSLDREQLAIINRSHPLGYGDYTLNLIATDKAGNVSEITPISFHLDLSLPRIHAGLANDTGMSERDGLTFDPTIAGNVIDGSKVVRLQARINPSEGEDLFIDVTDSLKEDNNFVLNNQQLEKLNGDRYLADGHYTIDLIATDKAGNNSQISSIDFTLDRSVPDLMGSLAQDTGRSNQDGITFDPTIAGQTRDNNEVVNLKAALNSEDRDRFEDLSDRLQEDGSFVLSSEDLQAINGDSLADGDYTLNLIAIDKAGIVSDPLTVPFLLDTIAPQIELTDLTEGSSINQDSFLAGMVDEDMVMLTYRFNDGEEIEVDLDHRDFSQLFDLTGVETGKNTLTLTATDKAGNIGEKAIAVVIVAENNPPVLTIPEPQIVGEDEVLEITGVRVEDLESDELTVTLAVNHGVVDLLETTGLEIAIADRQLTLAGSQEDINNALATLVYQGNPDFNGEDAIAITLSDGELEDSKTVPVTVTPVNDAPVLTIPNAQTVAENSNLTITGISVSDIDVEDGNLEVTLGVNNGVISLPTTTGLEFTEGDGVEDSSATFTGNLEDINNAIAQLVYRSDISGDDEISITVNDLGNSGAGGDLIDTAVVDVTVIPINDAPVLTVPNAQTVAEDESLNIAGISVSDRDSENLEITLAVNNGEITLGDTTGLTFTLGDGVADSSFSFSGEIADINNALANLSYQGDGNFNGSDAIALTVSDGELEDSKTILIEVTPINDAPILTVPNAQTVLENEELNITGISVDDIDVGDRDLEVALEVNNGVISLPITTGLDFSDGDGTGNKELVFTGSLENINNAIATITYQGDLDFNGSDELRITVNDLGNTGAGGELIDSDAIAISIGEVNNPPSLTIPAAQTVAEDEALTIAEISVSDSDSEELTVTLAVNNGLISLPTVTGVEVTTDEKQVTLTGSVADLNTALEGINYQGDANFNGDDEIALTVSDGELENSASIPLTITPVNDAPVLTVPNALTTNEDTELNITGINVDDIDVGDGDLEITLAVNNGVLSLPETTGIEFSNGDGVEDSSVTFTGTLEDINNALASIVYLGNLDFNGNDELSVTVSDLGNTGAGGELIADGSIDITVTPVDDSIVLLEGNNFRVEATETITIPNEPSVLRFTYSDLVFDTEDTDFINDGFEVALVDAEGNSLIQTIANSRDAFFNLTEGEDASLANGVSLDGETVTVNLAGIAPGTEANLIFRLVNNDDDTTTTVRITDFEVEAAAVTPPSGVTPNIAAINITEEIDFASLEDVSASFVAQYERTSFNEEIDTLYVDVAVNNQAQYLVDAPLLVVVENLSDASVTVLDADGFTPEGLPYFDFTSLVNDGTLDPNEITDSRTISFLNPNGVQFDYDLTFLGNLNQAPEFTSEPDLEAIVGKPYTYDADAIDADEDTLTYSLSIAPEGMTIDSDTGEINWSPQVGEEGTYNVIVVVEDGRGGVAEQNYTISAIAPPPNRPPVITSAPVISGNVGTDYNYPVVANDPDGDTLTYAVTQAPEGLAIDEDTGEITWNPNSEQVGANDVVVEVSDENGATAIQSYQIVVAQALDNNPPVIVSDPITQVNIDRREFGNPEPIDLSSWSVIQYPSQGSPNANWEIQPDTDNSVVVQTVNAAPSIFIGDFELANNKVAGTWEVDTSNDNDLMGFVFGYQDSQNFYLFDWKQSSQSAGSFGFSEIGMSVKIVSTDTEPTGFDLWPTEGVEGRVTNIFDNDIGWDNFTEYGFSLEFLPGQFSITVTEEETGIVVESVTIEDDTFTDGGFGFYNYSQNEVIYSGFELQSLPTGDYLYDVDAIDPDNDVVNYELIDAPSGMGIDTNTGEVTWNPTENDLGTYDLTVAAKDDKGGVDTQTYQLEVTDREVGAIEGTIFSEFTDNPNPVAQANVDVYLDTNDNGVLDLNEPTETTAVDDPNTLNIDETGQYSFDNLVNGTYTVRQIVPSGFEQINPENDAAYTVVIDAEQTESDRDFTNRQTGELVNIAPTITSEAITEAEAGREYRYQVTATDPNPDLLTFDLPVKPEGMEINPDTGLIIWNPQQGRSGEVSVVARVRDGEGGVDLQTFNLNLVPPNFDPVITSTPPNTAGVEVPLAYQVIALDDVSDTLTYALDNAPVGASIDSDTGLLSWTPTSGQVGNSDFTVLVTDDRDGSTTQTFTIEALADFPNNDPVITSTPRTVVRVEDTYQYQVAASDPDSEPLSYSLDSAPAGMTVSDTGLIEWTTTPEQFGDNTVTLTVSDTRGGTAEQSFNIEVVSEIVNRNPVFESEPPRVVIAGETLIYNPVVTDPDGDRLTFYAERIFDSSDPLGLEPEIPNISEETPGFSINPDTGEIRWNPSFEDLGIVQIALSAADPYGGITTQVFELEVTAGNRPPLITSVPVTQSALGDNYAYGIVAEDPDGNAVTLNLEQAPSGMTLDGNTLIWQPEASQLGNAEVIISATDEFGAVTTQEFTVVVADTLPNRPPVITSTPDRVASPNVLYEYAVTATDPEGETLTYTVENAPDGLTIDENTGLIQWTPTAAQIGATEIIVNAIDPEGALSKQTFSLVVDVNEAPVIDSTPITNVDAGLIYQYDLQASDPDGERLTYTLVEAPEGMTIDRLGRIAWETDSSDVGTFDIEVAVSDPRGATVNQTYQLEVTVDTEAPVVNLLQNNTVVDIGSSVIFQINARDNVGVEELSLTVDGVPVALDARGQASVTIDSFGEINAVATATDAAGNISTDTAIVTGIDSSDVDAPFLDITSINDGDILTAPTDIIGTVDDDNLVSYSLSVAPLAGGEFIELASGTNPIVDGEIANFDTSLLQNDTYRLRLSATDAGGNTSAIEREVSIEGELKLGNFQLSFVDLTIPVSGIPITVARTYDTLDANEQDDFGFGWSLGIVDTNLRTSVPPSGLEAGDIYNPFSIGDRVYVTNPSTGRREGYTFSFEPPSRFNVFGTVRPRFIPDAGVTSTLSVSPADLVIAENGELFDFTTGIPYNPASGLFGSGDYTLTTKEGVAFRIDGNTGDVETVTDRNDNVLIFNDAGITSSTGEEITFERDAQNRITAVIDPAGERIEYGYDVNGDLVSVTDREDNTTSFEYSEDRAHYLDEVIDPLGRETVRNEYDENGRLTKILDASGAPLDFTYDPENFVTTSSEVLNEAGDVAVVITESDVRGNILRQVNPDGGEILRTYDVNDNLLTETDALGNTSSFSYDLSQNLISETNEVGEVTQLTYNNINDLTSITDPLGNTISYEYSNNNLVSSTDALNRASTFDYNNNGLLTNFDDVFGFNRSLSSFTYDTLGRQVTETDGLGNTITFTRDDNGRVLTSDIEVTTPNGTETVATNFTYDAEGRTISVTDPENNAEINQYNALGQIIAVIDSNDNRTEFTYNDRGEQTAITYPDGTTETFVYDLGGRLIAQTDRGGRITFFEYDLMNRLLVTILPDETPEDLSDNPRISQEYDLEGQLIASIDPLGNRTEFIYDAAGRQIEAIDALGNIFTSEYDAAGRQISTTDALDRTTLFTYDDINRLVETTFADGTSTTVDYPELGVEIRTDANGNDTRFEYDVEGRLTAVEDALGNRTEYTYDELGRLIAQEDANDNVTNYEYDSLGGIVGVSLSEGQKSSTVYDAVGNTISETDFNGDTITYEYDSLNRLTQENLPNGDTVNYSYTATGQLATVVDNRGTTTFIYDAQDRLVSRTEPDGRAIFYTYDLASNRTSVSSPGGTTNYSFDALNRISTVDDSEGGTTDYTYDAVSNLILTELPNGTEETRDYDLLNRLELLETTDASDNILSSYEYTRDNVGNILQTEETDRTVNYTYDPLYRLVREEIVDSTNGNRDIAYTYDDVGNRLTRVDSVEGTTTYNYNSNNQLLTKELDGETTTYTYDDNGQIITEASTDGTETNYTWDSKGRLIEAEVNDGTTTTTSEYEYDFEDIRVSQTVNGEETKYLIDNSQPFAQVREESDSDGTVKARYAHGLGASPILIVRNGNVSYYHGDQVDSTRLLTNESGNITDSYIYDAFGRILTRIGDTENNYLYTGEQFDEATGLNYLRARYLDSNTGRFISRDPFDGILTSPISRIAYPYGNNNPLIFTDPTGNFTIRNLLIGFGVNTIISGIVLTLTTDTRPPQVIFEAVLSGALSTATGLAGGALASRIVGLSAGKLAPFARSIVSTFGTRALITSTKAFAEAIGFIIEETVQGEPPSPSDVFFILGANFLTQYLFNTSSSIISRNSDTAGSLVSKGLRRSKNAILTAAEREEFLRAVASGSFRLSGKNSVTRRFNKRILVKLLKAIEDDVVGFSTVSRSLNEGLAESLETFSGKLVEFVNSPDKVNKIFEEF